MHSRLLVRSTACTKDGEAKRGQTQAGSTLSADPEAGKRPAPLTECQGEASALVAVHLDALKVSLELRGLNGVVQVRGDRIQLQQVVINLLMNGAGSMVARGSDRRFVLECAAEADDLVSVTVDDLGNGIAPGIAHRLHEPLFTTKENGMGMGLATSHSIVDADGGELTLSARECVGTRATFTLPRLAH